MFESNYNYVPNPYPPAPQPVPPPYIPPGPGPWPVPPVYVDPTLSIPKAAADAAVTGKLIASKLSLDKLTGSIKLINDALEIDGIVDAEIGQVPSKGEDGSIEWIDIARESDIISIREELAELASELTTAQHNIEELFIVNAKQETAIANLTETVNNLNVLINGDGQTPGLKDRIEVLEGKIETKLDAETFNEVIYGENGLDSRVSELESCCADVQELLQDIHRVIGNPAYYNQPIYQTMAEFETHLQAMQRDFDGGDIDEEVPEQVEVTNLIGMGYSEAELTLGRAGLFSQYSNGDEVIPEGMSKDSVVYDYDPQGNVLIGSVITLDVDWREE